MVSHKYNLSARDLERLEEFILEHEAMTSEEALLRALGPTNPRLQNPANTVASSPREPQ